MQIMRLLGTIIISGISTVHEQPAWLTGCHEKVNRKLIFGAFSLPRHFHSIRRRGPLKTSIPEIPCKRMGHQAAVYTLSRKNKPPQILVYPLQSA